MTDLVGALVIAVLAATTVGLWTARVALAASGRKVASSMVAAIEALAFVVAFEEIASNLAAIDKVVGYAVGVAIGTTAGLSMNEQLSRGQSSINVIVPGHRPGIGSAMHRLGWPATEHPATGPVGPVTTLLVVVDDTRLGDVLDDVRRLVPDAFVSVHQLRRVQPTLLPPHLRQVRSRRRASGGRRSTKHLSSPSARSTR